MSTKTTPSAPLDSTTAPAAARLRYVGPPGQTSPVFGDLVPQQIYTTADADFAAYLVATHPTYWQAA